MEVAHAEVFEHVTLILKDHGFFSTGDGIDIGNLYFSTHPFHFLVDHNFCILMMVIFFLVLEATPMRMCYPLESYLTNYVGVLIEVCFSEIV